MKRLALLVLVASLAGAVTLGASSATTVYLKSRSDKGRSTTHRSTLVTTDDENPHFAYVIVTAGESGVSGSGDGDDFAAASRMRDDEKGDFIWVRIGDERYVIRDAALIAEAHRWEQPVLELGRKQSEIGAKQARVGAMQAKIGAQQSKIGARQSRIGQEQGRLSTEVARAQSRGDDTEDLQRQIDELGERMNDLGKDMEALGEQMNILAREMEPLAARQSELGQRQSKASKELQENMERLAREAVESGKAESID